MGIISKISAIYSLEQLAAADTAVHRLHPLCKIIVTAVFIVTVVSFGRYSFGRLIPFMFYPAILMAVSETPYALLLKRVLVALPFCVFAGISNLVLERDTAFTVGTVAVSYGAVSFCTILLRVYLCVMAVLLLVSVTPFTQLTAQLRKLRVPGIFVIMFEMTYRYIGVLISEAVSMQTAYSLRGGGVKNSGAVGVDIRHAGSFAGCLLLRSFDRAERIYSAMKCRGYTLNGVYAAVIPLRVRDVAYCVIVCGLCVFFRIFDLAVNL